MSRENAGDPKKKQTVELEPLNLILDGPVKAPITNSIAYPPVPADPPHFCPKCKYNLTGLTSRICPECGTRFELRDTIDPLAHQPLFARILLSETTRLVIGGGLMMFWPIFANVEFSKKWPYVGWQWSYGGVLVWLAAILSLWVGFLVKIGSSQSWGNILLVIGFLGSFLMVLFSIL